MSRVLTYHYDEFLHDLTAIITVIEYETSINMLLVDLKIKLELTFTVK